MKVTRAGSHVHVTMDPRGAVCVLAREASAALWATPRPLGGLVPTAACSALLAGLARILAP